MADESLIRPTGRVLPTLEADGRRRWLSPRLARGRFLLARRIVAYALIAIFTLLPFLQVNGKPAVLLDVVNRRFTLLGYTFLPTDTMLLAILLVALILSIFLFTALAGRVWCGWACPQTVYMEFLFRPIERLCMGRAGVGGRATREVAGWRLAAMYLLFLLCSLYLAHTFLSYFVGVHELRQWMTQSPVHHPTSFLIVLFVTAAMMFDFTYFREQTCLIACPYGRLQSVLLDRDSLIVQYDRVRGEPRGRKKEAAGDCVDCTLCVQVCPTGIDIRDGLQFECIGCTQCIDACDAVMGKLSRPRGLIGYSSQAALAGTPRRLLRPRLFVYGTLVLGLLTLLSVLIAVKSPFDVHVTRQGGLPFSIAPDGRVENILRLSVTNRSDATQTLTIDVVDPPDVILNPPDRSLTIEPGRMTQKPIHLLAPAGTFQLGKRAVVIRVSDRQGNAIARRCQLFGPGVAGQEQKP